MCFSTGIFQLSLLPDIPAGASAMQPVVIANKFMEIRNTAVTLLLLALIIPEALLCLSHLFKSKINSQPWPSKKIVLTVGL